MKQSYAAEIKGDDFVIHQIFSRVESIMTLPLNTLKTLIGLLEKSKEGIGIYGSLPVRVKVSRSEGEVEDCIYIEWHYDKEDACHLGFWVSDRDKVLKALYELI